MVCLHGAYSSHTYMAHSIAHFNTKIIALMEEYIPGWWAYSYVPDKPRPHLTFHFHQWPWPWIGSAESGTWNSVLWLCRCESIFPRQCPIVPRHWPCQHLPIWWLSYGYSIACMYSAGIAWCVQVYGMDLIWLDPTLPLGEKPIAGMWPKLRA
jgi:hypothetical protein